MKSPCHRTTPCWLSLNACSLRSQKNENCLTPTGYGTIKNRTPFNLNFEDGLIIQKGTQWRSWLRHCATSRKVAGSIPDGVIGIFHWHNPSGRTMSLGSTQPPTEMSTSNISLGGVKAAGAYAWLPYHLHVPTVLKSGRLNLLEPSGPVQACNGVAFW